MSTESTTAEAITISLDTDLRDLDAEAAEALIKRGLELVTERATQDRSRRSVAAFDAAGVLLAEWTPREVVVVGHDGASAPMYRYRNSDGTVDDVSVVKLEDRPLSADEEATLAVLTAEAVDTTTIARLAGVTAEETRKGPMGSDGRARAIRALSALRWRGLVVRTVGAHGTLHWARTATVTGDVVLDEEDATDDYPPCPICGDPVDYCQGHGEIAEEVL